LPSNYTDLRHAGVRTGVQLGGFASINLLQEFSPELDKLSRVFTGRLHHN
jgi:hypothetical protein